jgi:hypothetical protein
VFSDERKPGQNSSSRPIWRAERSVAWTPSKKTNSITARKRLAHQRTLPLPLQKRRSDLDASICSIGHISRLQRVLDNDAEYVTPLDMLAELRVALEVEAYAARFLDHIEQAAAALAWLWKL